MNPHHSADDRPDPSEQPIRARVPEHVSGGAFSTGVIVMTAQSEFILDFVQNLGRPHQIVARVVMPHAVLPQLVDALHRNMDLYRQRWGELPNPIGGNAQQLRPAPGSAPLPQQQATGPNDYRDPIQQGTSSQIIGGPSQYGEPRMEQTPGSSPGTSSSNGIQSTGTNSGNTGSGNTGMGNEGVAPAQPLPPAGSGARQASAQEIYDDLKIRDELLSGSYANAVMIGHGPHEFSFDFITNFYPHSAVSARVFLAAGQVPRLYDSLKGTWDQLRQRWSPPGGSPPPYPPSDSGPTA